MSNAPGGKLAPGESFRAAYGAQRRITFAGASNCRDLGGYRTASGGSTRWGQIFRSDSLHCLTGDDLDRFRRMGLRRTYDLRRDDERAVAACALPAVHVPVTSQHIDAVHHVPLRTREDGEQWLFEDYRLMLKRSGPAFGRLFSHLAEPDGAPAIFYCMGGKDRTGMAAALLLIWLGVERETVLDDYELTGQFRGPEVVPHVVDMFVSLGIDRGAAVGMLGAPRWAMASALEELDSVHGGIESYLRGPGGVTPAALRRLRKRLLDPDGDRAA